MPSQADILFPNQGNENRYLNSKSKEVSKKDILTFNRIFGAAEMSEIEINNAYRTIIKNRTKWKEDPFSDDEVFEMSTNPPGRLSPIHRGFPI